MVIPVTLPSRDFTSSGISIKFSLFIHVFTIIFFLPAFFSMLDIIISKPDPLIFSWVSLSPSRLMKIISGSIPSRGTVPFVVTQVKKNFSFADAENALADEMEALDEAIYQAGLSAREKEQSALDTYYFDLIERARQHGLDVTALEEEQRTKNKELQDS